MNKLFQYILGITGYIVLMWIYILSISIIPKSNPDKLDFILLPPGIQLLIIIEIIFVFVIGYILGILYYKYIWSKLLKL